MDDTASQNKQTAGQTVADSPVSSSPHKEQEPITGKSSLELSEPELKVSKELEDIGVESITALPNITDEDREAGIKLSPQSAQVNTQPSGSIQSPLSQKEAEDVIRHKGDITQSIAWLATLVLKVFKRNR